LQQRGCETQLCLGPVLTKPTPNRKPQADVAVLVISSRKGEYETGFEKGGQVS
jgi:hypothetical protein